MLPFSAIRLLEIPHSLQFYRVGQIVFKRISPAKSNGKMEYEYLECCGAQTVNSHDVERKCKGASEPLGDIMS